MEKLCAIVLAAGLSSRMGEDKLLMDYHGLLMGEYILKSISENSGWFGQVLVVHRRDETRELALRYGFTPVCNPEPELGMGHSLALGVRTAGDCGGFLIALSDMPDLKSGTLHTLCDAFSRAPERIAVPLYGGRRGNPVIFPETLRPELATLCGDKGGRDILHREEQALARVQVYDPGILRDIDTREELGKR